MHSTLVHGSLKREEFKRNRWFLLREEFKRNRWFLLREEFKRNHRFLLREEFKRNRRFLFLKLIYFYVKMQNTYKIQ
jgi:hypothetical protein